MKISAIILAVLFSCKAPALELEGHTDFAQRFLLNLGVSGYVAEILVASGQSVKRGERLLSLDQGRLQASLERAQAMVQVKTPAHSQMLTILEKAQELFDRDSLALVELQQAENNLKLAKGELDIARADLIDAQLNLKQTNLFAPIDGIVLHLHTHKNRFINTQVADQTVVTLVDNKNMLAIAGLTVQQWNPELVGKSATIDFRGKKYNGNVIKVSNDLVQQSSGKGFYDLQVLFVASGEIPANMPVTIEIQE